MSIVTLLTDFGASDVYVGAMKGVILGFAPDAKIVDLTHEVDPQDILSGAYLLKSAYSFFPDETIHVAVVDPGVGTHRRAIGVKTSRYTFLAPDNGLLSSVLTHESPVGCYKLNKPEYLLHQVSATFHGRDVFAPIAGHLARGAVLDDIATAIDVAAEPLVIVGLPTPTNDESGWTVHVIHIDRFGNLVTDFEPHGALIGGITFAQQRIPFVQTYGEVPPHHSLALIGSSGHLEIALNQGNAAVALKAKKGDPVRVHLK